MLKQANIDRLIIGDKHIFVFEHHHFALLPWAEIKCKINEELVVISLDHHTDTHSPFLSFVYNNSKNKGEQKEKELVKSLIKAIDYRDQNTVYNAIMKLKHDEHIYTAIETKIINKAFIISHDNYSDEPQSLEEAKRLSLHKTDPIKFFFREGIASRPRTYPFATVYMPPYEPETELSIMNGFSTFSNLDIDNIVLEDDFLFDKFKILNEMCPAVVSDKGTFSVKYILDIDLDYFHSNLSIEPKSCSVFYNLIRNAEIITIAKESVCVDLLKHNNEDINSGALLEKLFSHIRKALEN
ncbi:UPF0489 family protein [Paenibacillus donghaensis]|uniref:Uncharacterized protein n=1 Tax=Paenibacillus donghaensis TaxID=414771 RepID=A0A2Z2KQ01_9BACL|nr:UPF0489 family protein [Paenibacillus donghaensis]ASA23422.1 hypothetical protein B9T62_23015 [Paenibacillus donghaensis]